MSIRVIDNKRLELSEDEWQLYQKICSSYTTVSNKGSDLFEGLFASDDKGIITMLIPPSKKHTSMEVYMFLMSIQQQQHIRLMHNEVSHLCKQMTILFNDKLKELNVKLSDLEKANANR